MNININVEILDGIGKETMNITSIWMFEILVHFLGNVRAERDLSK